MTPAEWYSTKRAAYFEATGVEWRYRTDQANAPSHESSEVQETAMRAGIECRALRPTSHEELMMIVNAILIRDKLSGRRRTNAGD